MDSPMLRYVRHVMIISGTLPVHLVNSLKGLYIFHQYVVQTSLFIFLIFTYTPITKIHESVELMIRILADIILFTVMYIKGRFCMSKNMNNLITDLIIYEAKLRMNHNAKIMGIYEKIVKKSQLIQIVYLVMVNSSAVAFIAPHYVNYFVSSHKSNLYFWWLPFDDEKHHMSALLLETYCAVLATAYYCFTSIILIVLPLHIILRLKVLKTTLGGIEDIGTNGKDKLNAVRTEIIMCIEEHIDIIRNCVLLNNSVKYIMLLEFLLSSFQLALALFQIISIANLTKIMFSLIFVVLTLVQLLVLYWHANEIREESLDVANVVYALPWYQYDKSIKTSLCLVMMRSQKALTLTVGPFGSMTLEMFVKIIKGVYTYMTLMQQQTYD